MYSPLEQFDVIPVILGLVKYDLSFTNTLLPLLITIAVFCIAHESLDKCALLVPTMSQYILESLTDFVFSIVRQQLGKIGYVFFPLIFTLFSLILLSNYLSLLPSGIALTSHIIITLLVSVGTCLSITIVGV